MTKNNRKPLIALVALCTALAMPLAFAQEKTEDAATQQTQATPTASQATGATGATTQDPARSTQSAAQAKQGWADVDTDGDGAISKQEASTNAGLSQVFDQADTDADSKLSADEYKVFVGKHYGDQKK